eukprot:TRINITY_DN9401_c0_g1_i1.p1 TRINITY_DN9401_c0_g1~~TRINITY_DN9401_c0_g1_i1.p1  ORF type:complete len:513 (-),score=111.60 TRINITY_DN9401_c0_g1_i1:277-1815(-)
MRLWPLPLLLLPAWTQEDVACTAAQAADVSKTLRPAKAPVALADIIGLGSARDVLREAVVLPLSANAEGSDVLSRVFWRSSELSAPLLVGPSGLGKAAAVEAAAAAAGAQIMHLQASSVLASAGRFCSALTEASQGRRVVVLVESLELAPAAALSIRQCLRDVVGSATSGAAAARVVVVATMEGELRTLGPSELASFGYVVTLGAPNEAERKQFLLKLFAQVSRVDPQWSAGFREADVAALAALTKRYTFAEMELVVRRAFLRSSSSSSNAAEQSEQTAAQSARDPASMTLFEQILQEMGPQALDAFEGASPAGEPVGAASSSTSGKSSGSGKDKKKGPSKDPMEGVFGWCNALLPEALHLPPVVWAMMLFGILAHFMARSTYQPYGHRKRRGGNSDKAPGRGTFFGDFGSGGGSNPYGSIGSDPNDWYAEGSPFSNFPPPPGMPKATSSSAAAAGSSAPAAGDASAASAAAKPSAGVGGGGKRKGDTGGSGDKAGGGSSAKGVPQALAPSS